MQKQGVGVAIQFRSFAASSSSSICSIFGFKLPKFSNAVVTSKPHVPLFSNLTSEWTGFPEGCGPSLRRGRKPNQTAGEAQLWSSPLQRVEEQLATDVEEPSFGRIDRQNAEPVEKSMEHCHSSNAVHLDREQFTRSYDLAALRVSADECWDSMQRIKGHLLNWPRLKNVARVPGDDVEEQMQDLFWNGEEKMRDVVTSVREAVYEEGIPSEKLDTLFEHAETVTKFRTKGRLAYPELEKLSRLKRHQRRSFGASKRSKTERKERRSSDNHKKKVTGSSQLATVEIVEDSMPIRGDDEPAPLEFEKNTWRGSTRLLLLDEQHAGKRIHELPMAVQTILWGSINRDKKKVFELVQCQLSIHYAYWPLDELLRELLPVGILLPSAFETVGHIAHLNLQNEHLPYRYLIAQVVLDKHYPKIRSVVNKQFAIQNQYRTMQLELLAGSQHLVTTVFEHGLTFHLDLATVMDIF